MPINLWQGDFETIKDLPCPSCKGRLHPSFFGGLVCGKLECKVVIDPDTKERMLCPKCNQPLTPDYGMLYDHSCPNRCHVPAQKVIPNVYLAGGPDGIEDTDFPGYFYE